MKKLNALLLIIFMVSCSVSEMENDLTNKKDEGKITLIKEEITAGADSSSETGTLEIHVYTTSIVNGQYTHSPFSRASIFMDDNSPYGGPAAEAVTDSEGTAILEVSGGSHTFRVAQMTSSHSYFVSEEMSTYVRNGGKTQMYFSVVITHATIKANYDCGWGNALYITGQGELLGHWNTAYKLSPVSGGWQYYDYLSKNIEYKIILAPWTDDDSINLYGNDNFSWETGANRVLQNAAVYYPTYNEITPNF